MNKIMKEFVDEYGVNLIVTHNKNNIILETNSKNLTNDLFVRIVFDNDIFKEFRDYLETLAKDLWSDFSPKEATSFSSDYDEYYDRKYDNSACLSFNKSGVLRIEKPATDCLYLYKFNKRRLESFIYDLTKYL